MIVYKVFHKNYVLKKGELMGALIERRKDFRGITPMESGLKWARLTFGDKVANKQAIYVVPDELRLKDDANWPIQKTILTKEEFLEVMKTVDQEMKGIIE
jgi:hypothetical protein